MVALKKSSASRDEKRPRDDRTQETSCHRNASIARKEPVAKLHREDGDASKREEPAQGTQPQP